MKKAYAIGQSDNVATALEAISAGEKVEVVGEVRMSVEATTDIPDAHKIALAKVAPGEGIFKLGTRIGTAKADISPGDWVHLHNARSDYDARAEGADLETGIMGDTTYE